MHSNYSKKRHCLKLGWHRAQYWPQYWTGMFCLTNYTIFFLKPNQNIPVQYWTQYSGKISLSESRLYLQKKLKIWWKNYDKGKKWKLKSLKLDLECLFKLKLLPSWGVLKSEYMQINLIFRQWEKCVRFLTLVQKLWRYECSKQLELLRKKWKMNLWCHNFFLLKKILRRGRVSCWF